jgi:hypothetical protein
MFSRVPQLLLRWSAALRRFTPLGRVIAGVDGVWIPPRALLIGVLRSSLPARRGRVHEVSGEGKALWLMG